MNQSSRISCWPLIGSLLPEAGRRAVPIAAACCTALVIPVCSVAHPGASSVTTRHSFFARPAADCADTAIRAVLRKATLFDGEHTPLLAVKPGGDGDGNWQDRSAACSRLATHTEPVAALVAGICSDPVLEHARRFMPPCPMRPCRVPADQAFAGTTCTDCSIC